MTTFVDYRFDYESFLEQQGFDVSSTSGGEARGRCPFCWSDSRAPFSVNADTGAWICHHCDERGGPVQLVMRIARCSWKEAKELLEANDIYSRGEYVVVDDVPAEVAIQLPSEFQPFDDESSSTSEPYRRYAHQRGLTDKLLRGYGIGYCATGHYARRIVVPVTNGGVLVSFVARDITGRALLKVLYPKGARQGHCLFNVDDVREMKRVVVVEGVFDALVLPEMAVATFGKTMSDAQAALLMRAGVEGLLFAYDADAALSSETMAERFSVTFDTRVLMLPPEQDPSSLGRDSMLELLAPVLR